jgi:hypothetical protein
MEVHPQQPFLAASAQLFNVVFANVVESKVVEMPHDALVPLRQTGVALNDALVPLLAYHHDFRNRSNVLVARGELIRCVRKPKVDSLEQTESADVEFLLRGKRRARGSFFAG